jgi:hypothetical protein
MYLQHKLTERSDAPSSPHSAPLAALIAIARPATAKVPWEAVVANLARQRSAASPDPPVQIHGGLGAHEHGLYSARVEL